MRPYDRYHAWRAPFPLWARIVCDILFWALTAAAAYVAIGSLCGVILVAAPLLGFLALASSKEHDDGIDWSDHRMGGQPRNPVDELVLRPHRFAGLLDQAARTCPVRRATAADAVLTELRAMTAAATGGVLDVLPSLRAVSVS
ncbi:hypothetical protein ABZ250_33365 [Streptomyces afghaniensis]|uniref:hypothetical protein n=1 Tax=Streptomyces afghaniensis TaxID=66865 RepID=UPI00339DDEE7